MTVIQDTLRLFGITRCYKGFLHTAYAIQLAVEDEDRLEAVTKAGLLHTPFISVTVTTVAFCPALIIPPLSFYPFLF